MVAVPAGIIAASTEDPTMTLSEQGYNELERVFHEKDAAWLQERRARLDADRKSAAARSAHGAHWMVCPKCGGRLNEENFHGVAIDRCGGCGGVYLDKGELELLGKAQQGGLRRLFGGR
jgi:hypothetical protein